MTDYQLVRKEAESKGPLPEGTTSPIPIQPTTEWSITRLIVLPVIDQEKKKKVPGLYMRVPAIITVPAWNAGEASARADEIQANTKVQAWGQGGRPGDGESKMNWREVPVPAYTKPLQLR
jgi:hypothetical protein